MLSRSVVEGPVVVVVSVMDSLSSEVKDVVVVDGENSLEVSSVVSNSEFLFSLVGVTVSKMVSSSLSNFGFNALSGTL